MTLPSLFLSHGSPGVILEACPGRDFLAGLGGRLALPEGWSFRTRVLDEELVVDTTATIATVLQDELENTYTLPT